MRAGRSHSGFGPAPMHGRGATFVAVASSRPNSARRGATPPWTNSAHLRHSHFNCRCPRCSPGIRGRFTCAPPRQDVCLPRLAWVGMSGFKKRYGLDPVASTTHTETLHSCRLPPHPTRLCFRRGPKALHSLRVGLRLKLSNRLPRRDRPVGRRRRRRGHPSGLPGADRRGGGRVPPRPSRDTAVTVARPDHLPGPGRNVLFPLREHRGPFAREVLHGAGTTVQSD